MTEPMRMALQLENGGKYKGDDIDGQIFSLGIISATYHSRSLYMKLRIALKMLGKWTASSLDSNCIDLRV